MILTKVLDIAVDWYRDKRSNFPTNTSKERGNWPGGEALTIQELRVLRALSGEDRGRFLYHYRDNNYYKQSLDDLVRKEFIKLSDNKYYLTTKGKKYAVEYLLWLSKSWKSKN